MDQQAIKLKLNEVIFGTETPAGKAFDVVLIIAILTSVLVLMLESIQAIGADYRIYLRVAEWGFTLAFTLEYMLRLYSSPQTLRYAGSFYGLIDLISILPSYVSLVLPGTNILLIIRLLRVLRIFRVLKLIRYLGEANLLLRSIMLARRKIFVFFSGVLVLATIFGSLMYVVEGPANGFSSIPKSIYWTIVTITTVGYGDITPQTVVGQIVASMVMLTGYSIIAVPTGILTAELAQEMQREKQSRRCATCGVSGHDADALYCRLCGARLQAPRE